METHQTHPWINFKLRLPLDDYRLWMRLGEIASKCEHLAGVPLRPDVAEELHRVFLAKGALATTAIEGNTLSEEQVRRIMDGNLKLPPSQKYLEQEVRNIIDLCNEETRLQLAQDEVERPRLCPELIHTYNRRVLHDLDVGDDVVPGQIRSHSVLVGRIYRGAPAQDCEELLSNLCTWLNGSDFQPQNDEMRIPFALVRAIAAHVYLAWIHPFGDGNGRTARMVEFHILFSSGVPLPAAHLLSDHYNITRAQYYRELARASGSPGGDIIPFIRYATLGFLDGLRSQIAKIREQQLRVAWENYIHDQFREWRNSATQKRRRDLVIELSGHDWVDVPKIKGLNTDLAVAYGAAGERTLGRDLNSVAAMGLISRRHGKVRANRELIQAFLPDRVGQ